MPKKNTLTSNLIERLKIGNSYEFTDCEDLDLLSKDNYRAIDDTHVVKLEQSIKEAGLKTEVSLAIKVYPDGGRKCVIEDGHHRVEAVRRLRDRAKTTGNEWLKRPLPCRLKVRLADADRSKSAVDSVLKNQLQKEETIWDKADAYKSLRDAGETTPSISVMVGVDERSVRRTLSLLKIPEDVRAFAEANTDGVKAASLYKLAATIGDVADSDIANKSVTDLLAKKASEKGFRGTFGEAQSAAIKVLQNWASKGGSKAADGANPVMAAYLALDFLALDFPFKNTQPHLSSAHEESAAVKGRSKEADDKSRDGGNKRNGAKAEATKRLSRQGSTSDVAYDVEGVRTDNKSQWRGEVMAKIKKLGLDDDTLEAVTSAVMGWTP